MAFEGSRENRIQIGDLVLREGECMVGICILCFTIPAPQLHEARANLRHQDCTVQARLIAYKLLDSKLFRISGFELDILFRIPVLESNALGIERIEASNLRVLSYSSLIYGASQSKRSAEDYRDQCSGCAVHCRAASSVDKLILFPARILGAYLLTYSLRDLHRACNLDWRLAHTYNVHNRAKRRQSTSTFRQRGSNADGTSTVLLDVI